MDSRAERRYLSPLYTGNPITHVGNHHSANSRNQTEATMSSSKAFTSVLLVVALHYLTSYCSTDLACLKIAAKVAIRTPIEPSKLQAWEASATGCRRLLPYYQEITRTLERDRERGQTTNSESVAFSGDSAALCDAL